MRRDLQQAPSLGDIEAMARRAHATIPEPLRARIAEVPIRVQDFPDAETVRELALESAFDLLGLYQGVGLERREASDFAQDVDMIFLYRRPILDYWCDSGDALEDIVRHVLIHEVGHHFGLSDADMEALEAAAETPSPVGATNH
ncbi:MAG: metallopeptidase family protein [Alphaproteobacteria bacterium]|jgi:predicted Zn-dependent protease with MMP-like domain|nr:metallopeptidase family protein [Alphaproteobacteria bacterium]